MKWSGMRSPLSINIDQGSGSDVLPGDKKENSMLNFMKMGQLKDAAFWNYITGALQPRWMLANI